MHLLKDTLRRSSYLWNVEQILEYWIRFVFSRVLSDIDENGKTCLIAACIAGHVEVTIRLLELSRDSLNHQDVVSLIQKENLWGFDWDLSLEEQH